MAPYKNLLIVFSVLLAIAAPIFMAMNARQAQESGQVVKLQIETYDPRDLLYGHYMRFAIKWNWKGGKPEETTCQGRSCCLCLGEGEQDPSVSLTACPSKGEIFPQCRHILKGNYHGNGMYDVGIDRYFVNESIAVPLETLFRNKKEDFHVGLSISPQGKAVIEKLYIGGQVVDEYVQQHYQELASPAPEK